MAGSFFSSDRGGFPCLERLSLNDGARVSEHFACNATRKVTGYKPREPRERYLRMYLKEYLRHLRETLDQL